VRDGVRVTDQGGMTEQDEFRPDPATACHEMLLRLAGRVPGNLMTQSRAWLAHGDLSAVADSLASVIMSRYVVLAEPDTALLSALLSEANIDSARLAQLTLGDIDPFPSDTSLPSRAREAYAVDGVAVLALRFRSCENAD
jgi:hypothetical protein